MLPEWRGILVEARTGRQIKDPAVARTCDGLVIHGAGSQISTLVLADHLERVEAAIALAENSHGLAEQGCAQKPLARKIGNLSDLRKLNAVSFKYHAFGCTPFAAIGQSKPIPPGPLPCEGNGIRLRANVAIFAIFMPGKGSPP